MIEQKEKLESLAKQAVDEGTLPRIRVRDFIGRYGAPFDTRCPVCQHPVLGDEMSAITPAETIGFLVLHVSCFHAWQMGVPAEAEQLLLEQSRRRRSASRAR